jgi:DNA-binding transcriptional LysR family regulator
MPTFRQLEIFLEAAVDCNFRMTADRLGISQPSLSKQIQALERGLGYRLFDRRRGTPPTLSAAGGAALGDARNSLRSRRAMSGGPADGERMRRLRICVRHFLLENRIKPRLVEGFAADAPFLPQFVIVDDVEEMASRLRSGAADLAVYRGHTPDHTGLRNVILQTIPTSLYAAPAIAEQIARGVLDIAAAPFLLPPEDSRIHRWILAGLEECGVVPANVAGRTQFADIVAKWVVAGRGIGILFDEHMRDDLAAGSVVRLDRAMPSVYTILLAADNVDDRTLDAANSLFLSLLADNGKSLGVRNI